MRSGSGGRGKLTTPRRRGRPTREHHRACRPSAAPSCIGGAHTPALSGAEVRVWAQRVRARLKPAWSSGVLRRLRGPGELPEKRDECTRPVNDLFVNLGTLPSNQHQFLALSRPHRDEQPPSLRQLVHERGRHRRRRGRNHDDVEWSILPPTDGAVSDHERHVVDPELIQHGARAHREFTDPFDRVDTVGRERQ